MKKKKKKKTAFDLDAALAAESGETMEQQSKLTDNQSAEDGKLDDALLDLDADLDLENFGKKKKKKKKPFMSLEEEQQAADSKDGETIEPEEAGDVEGAGDDLGFDFNLKKKKKKKKDLNDILKEEEQKDADKENGRSIFL